MTNAPENVTRGRDFYLFVSSRSALFAFRRSLISDLRRGMFSSRDPRVSRYFLFLYADTPAGNRYKLLVIRISGNKFRSLSSITIEAAHF